MNVPLEPGDVVVSMAQVYRPDAPPALLVVTREGHLYEITYDPDRRDYTVQRI